jgi:hypothetical protein
MKTEIIRLLAGVLAWAALPILADTTVPTNAPGDFSQAVPFELGTSGFAAGDSITIQEVRGTNDKIQPGDTYCVTGTYTLKSQAEASLSLFETIANSGPTPVDPRQTINVMKGTGTFSLVKHVTDKGYLHVSFYSHDSGQGFGGVYFGQGEWVLRHPFSHLIDSISRKSEPVSGAVTNQALVDYLGNAVAVPTNLGAAYTKEGLTRAMQSAARNAGISLAKLQIDDSEFPFLVGVVCASRSDMEKLKDQIRMMSEYNYTGGVGGDERYAMNLVPYNVYPPNARQRIYHRMSVREEMFYDQMNGENN